MAHSWKYIVKFKTTGQCLASQFGTLRFVDPMFTVTKVWNIEH